MALLCLLSKLQIYQSFRKHNNKGINTLSLEISRVRWSQHFLWIVVLYRFCIIVDGVDEQTKSCAITKRTIFSPLQLLKLLSEIPVRNVE